eukprot:750017-Hanusia_phi.AAC.4
MHKRDDDSKDNMTETGQYSRGQEERRAGEEKERRMGEEREQFEKSRIGEREEGSSERSGTKKGSG